MAMMISKFHKLIQSKVVWTAFAVVISVAFVGVYTGASSRRGQSPSKELKKPVGVLWGQKITREEYDSVHRDVFILADLNYLMQTGQGIPENEMVMQALEQQSWTRLATMIKAEKMGLKVTDEQVKQAITTFPAFRNPQTGGFERQMYDYMMQQVFRQRYRMGEAGFANLMRRNVLIQKALGAAGQGALVTEDEIKDAFHLYNDKLTVAYAALPRSIADEPEVTDDLAQAYYNRNPDQFRMPEKRIIHYVEYPIVDYTNTVSVTDEMVAQVYEGNKQSFIKPETATNAVPEYKTLEEVRGEITSELTMGLAQRAAADAADQLFSALATPGSTFAEEAEKAGLKVVKTTPAFAATGPVRGTDPTAPVARAAFNLVQTDTHYYSEPVGGRETVYILALQKILPAFLPNFDVVKADVVEATRIAEAETAYVEKAASIHADIEAAVKGGASFADAAAKYNLELQQMGPFSASEPPTGEFAQELTGATIQLDKGVVAEPVDTTDLILVAYVADKEIADEAATLPGLRAQLSQGLRMRKAQELAQAWQASLLDEAGFERIEDEKPAADDA